MTAPVVTRTARGVAVTIPLHTVSEANTQRSKWREKNRRTREQRLIVCCTLKVSAKAWLRLPVVVTLVRVAPRSLDDDNLATTLKADRDGVADALGLKSDADPRVTWRYGQERGAAGEYAVRVELHAREDGPASDVALTEDALAIAARVEQCVAAGELTPAATDAARGLLAALRSR